MHDDHSGLKPIITHDSWSLCGEQKQAVNSCLFTRLSPFDECKFNSNLLFSSVFK